VHWHIHGEHTARQVSPLCRAKRAGASYMLGDGDEDAKVMHTSIEKLYGEFSMREPMRMVPGLTLFKDFLTPSTGLQNGSE
jgi:hypothetical protein